jgi:CHASE1-domain containing sensor protein
MTKKLNIPGWGYALIALLGPAFCFSLIFLGVQLLAQLWNLFAKFPYWWAVAVAIVYLLFGTALAGLVSSFGADSDE